MFNHFSKMNERPIFDDDNLDRLHSIDNIVYNDINDNMLGQPITAQDISKSIRKLKNNKAHGLDQISNEFLKSAENTLLPVLLLLFNRVLDTGTIPENWTMGVIIPIYKEKGDQKSPDNYRGITLLSCMGKLFTSIINDRLTQFLEDNHLLHLNQAGFRKNHGVCDHIFSLKSIVDIFLSTKRKLYCAFIDYQKAFDTIWRKALWHKLITIGINGKILKLVFNMYQNIKSSIFVNGEKSNVFNSFIGLRQGENLSPLLFSIFVNDLETYLLDNGCNPVNIDVADEQNFWLKILVLLYADDTILLSESPDGLQHALNILSEYCNIWKLVINCKKTKA